MKHAFFLTIALLATTPLSADEPEEIKVVYPAAAAVVELDSSTPSKRAEPPVRETSEFDPVTPLGQIQNVLESLTRIEKKQEELRDVAKPLDSTALLDDLRELFPSKNDAEELSQNSTASLSKLAELSKSTNESIAKLAELSKTIEDVRATVESIQATAETVERIRASRWTDYAVIATLALIAIQIIGKVAAVVVNQAKATKNKLEELAKAYAAAAEGGFISDTTSGPVERASLGATCAKASTEQARKPRKRTRTENSNL